MEYYFVKETEQDEFKVIAYGKLSTDFFDAAVFYFTHIVDNEENEFETKGRIISKEEFLKLVKDNKGKVFVKYFLATPSYFTYPLPDCANDGSKLLRDFVIVLVEKGNGPFLEGLNKALKYIPGEESEIAHLFKLKR